MAIIRVAQVLIFWPFIQCSNKVIKFKYLLKLFNFLPYITEHQGNNLTCFCFHFQRQNLLAMSMLLCQIIGKAPLSALQKYFKNESRRIDWTLCRHVKTTKNVFVGGRNIHLLQLDLGINARILCIFCHMVKTNLAPL